MNFKHIARAVFIFALILTVTATWRLSLQVLIHKAVAQEVTPGQAASDVANRRAKLESDLKILESQIEAQQQIIQDQEKQANSLEREISIFDAKIKEANLSIKARNIRIQNLTNDIAGKQKTIGELSNKLSRELDSLSELIRATNQIDGTTLPEIIIGNKTVSGLFSDIDNFNTLEDALSKSREVVQANKQETEDEKKNLEDKKTEEVQLRAIQVLEQKRIVENKAAKAKLLKDTRGQEAVYQKILTDRQKDAAEIRSELFILQGSTAISFEKAYEYATGVNLKTGVRPAFLLAIITEETNLGENLGSGNWRVDMNPKQRDQFQKITAELGLAPDNMPVSKKPWYGWGGAMGPAQFIPSTWILYQSKIASLTGHSPPNPWDPYDAFMAAGLYLKDSGASAKTYKAEFRAAMCYLAGCNNVNKKSLQFYGRDVVDDLAVKYQRQIDILQRN